MLPWNKSSDDDGKFNPLDLEDISKVCLDLYLRGYRCMICDGDFQDLDIFGHVSEIGHIFESLSRYSIQAGASKLYQVNMNRFREVSESTCCNNIIIPYFTAEAPTCFDSYNQPRLGGGRLFEHAALNHGSAHLSQITPCCPVAV